LPHLYPTVSLFSEEKEEKEQEEEKKEEFFPNQVSIIIANLTHRDRRMTRESLTTASKIPYNSIFFHENRMRYRDTGNACFFSHIFHIAVVYELE